MPFVRQIIDAFDSRAQAAGVKVVQVCGFESIPPDLAVLLASETARALGRGALGGRPGLHGGRARAGWSAPKTCSRVARLQTFAAVAGGDNAALIADPAALAT